MRYPKFLMAFCLSVLCLNCTDQSGTVREPSIQAQQELEPLGQQAASQLASNLQQALLNTITEEGPSHAISVCADTAQQLTARISRELGQDITVKRTSARIRNPRNAPDPYEQAALDYYQNVLAKTDTLPGSHVQKITADGEVFYRYYKPMQVNGLCLTCHGSPAEMEPEVYELLQERYPGDKALGYEVGDFRGVISVTVNRDL